MLRRLLLLAILAALAVFGGRALLLAGAAGTPDAAAPGDVTALASGQHRPAIIFGAGVRPGGRPSALLQDRISAGAALVASGQADLLLMSGDNSIEGYNEPGAMRAAALRLGVPPAKVAVDYGGRRTWDSCLRAREVFGIRRAITVSNDFHRARSIVLCEAAGIEVVGAVGTSTGRFPARARVSWRGRETIASWRGAVDAWVKHPSVPVGGPPIDPYDACAVWKSLSDQDRAAVPGAAPSGC